MSLDVPDILHLYQFVVTAGLLQYMQQQIGMKVRRGVYCPRVVLWLMMLQRLHRGATLFTAVQLLMQGAAEPLLQNCHRVRQRKISARTGGYCQAREKLPKLLCRRVNEEIIQRLRQVLRGAEPDQPEVFLLDGSSLELAHCPELVRNYPPAQNQHGRSHWPILRIVVAHDVDTGMAQSPCWGPMYGGQSVSEQELAEQLITSLPAGATVLGDRNFGVFWVAWAAQQSKLGVVLRLTEVRARKLVGSLSQPGDYEVAWQASRWDGGKRRSFDRETVKGRLIATRIGRGKSKQWLYLFTTLSSPVEAVVTLYGRRWNIETDLRSLKRTVNLQHIHAKSQDMFEKELWMAVSAYNFVRAVMAMAARRNNIDPRQLSFSGVLTVVNCAWPKLIATPTQPEVFLHMLDLAAQCTLPKRRKPRSYPRAVWRHRSAYPNRRQEKTK